MTNFKMIALTTPVPGKEDAFNDWYQNIHLPELTTLPGMCGAQRYELVTQLMGTATNPWLAIYDIDCEDPAQFLAAMGEAATSGELTQTDASDKTRTYTALFRAHGARVSAGKSQ